MKISRSSFFAFLLISFIGFFYYKNAKGTSMKIKVVTPAQLVHHLAFTSVYSTLVKGQQNKEFKGELASKWSHDADFKTWEFEIRNNLHFSNGDLITPEIIATSLKRIAFLKRKENSKSGLMEYLIGFDNFLNFNDENFGISVSGQKIILRFSTSVKDVLEKVSFGLYSIVNPKAYDHLSLEWLDQTLVISSGSYSVGKWDNEKFELILRDDFNPFNLKNRIKEIEFLPQSKIINSNDLNDIDIVVSDSESKKVDERFEFVSSKMGNKISYVFCYGWNQASSLLNDLVVRKSLREKLYSSLERQNYKVTTSFFPLKMVGVLENKRDKNFFDKNSHEVQEITIHEFPHSKLLDRAGFKSISEVYEKSFEEMAQAENLKLVKLKFKDGMEYSQFDLAVKGTGIDINDPLEDIRFMFLSKHGIKLPDESGEILKELNNKEPNIKKINQLLWEQAIIWPLRHYDVGLWSKVDSNINFSETNIDSLTLDFQFLNWK